MSAKSTQPLWILVAGYWLWMIWACAGEWSHNQDYNYGWFVPPLALYFLLKRGEGAKVGSSQAAVGNWQDRLAWAVVLVSLLLIFPIELVRQTPIHWRPVLWIIGQVAFANTLAVAWLSGGRAALRTVMFPAAFMLLGIPWPTFAEGAISFPLMQSVTQWSVGIMHLFGYPATAAGTTISLSNCTVGVEEACSGLRSLQTALMVGAAAGELVRLRTVARIALLAVGFAMALAGNQVRVLMLVMAGVSGGNAAVSHMHDTAGYVVLAILLGGVGGVAWVLGKIGGGENEDRGLEIGDLRDQGRRRSSWQVAGGNEGGESGAEGRFESGELR
ncbi:MAG: hypothetical protein RIQ71_1354, partial [Verrucomicrobiota bacterium]